MNGDGNGFDVPDDSNITRLGDQPDSLPKWIGNYRILEKVGEGGMGEVYLAEQEQPVRRRVALKLIKPGMDSRQVVARFESERQALAMMNHPNIAHVFDTGITEQGRPYFAMEYVGGEPITAYCDKYRLGTAERLELVMEVCSGVQHAHQKGIIHRDIKPSNVLVHIRDGKPTPAIIDFGVAKATEQPLTEKTLYTQMGALMGTPEYMSPEQVEMSGLDVDTRTDVYALGVLLYELLVGTLPFPREELRSAGFDEIRRKIREDEPSKPSTRVSMLKPESESPLRRGTDARMLRRQLSGDLDWITMKAMEKDRTRRYGSPSELAADIRRHLNHEPVVAGPPSKVYRMGKFVLRHRVGVAFAALLLVLLTGFAITMTVQRQQVARERDQKEAARAQAVTEAAAASQVADFLEGLFSVSDPWETLGDTVTAREILDRGAARIREELSDQPLVQARMMRTIGRVYANMNLLREAGPLLEEALSLQREHLGAESLELARTMQELAGVVLSDGDLHRSRTLYERALEIYRKALGEDHTDVAASMNLVANVLNVMGDSKQAAEYWDKAYVIWDRHGDFTNMAKVENNRGLIQLSHGEPALAAERFDQALERIGKSEDPNHPLAALFWDNRARAELALGNLVDARADFDRALRIRRTVYGEVDPVVARSLLRLAMIDLHEGLEGSAAGRYRRAREMLEQTGGLGDPFALYELASYAALKGDRQAALRGLRRAVIEHGIYGAPRLLHDPNLERLRSDPEFEALVVEVKRRSGER